VRSCVYEIIARYYPLNHSTALGRNHYLTTGTHLHNVLHKVLHTEKESVLEVTYSRLQKCSLFLRIVDICLATLPHTS
jgi:hypothetical protein